MNEKLGGFLITMIAFIFSSIHSPGNKLECFVTCQLILMQVGKAYSLVWGLGCFLKGRLPQTLDQGSIS